MSRALYPLAVVALLAALIGGCGGDSSAEGTATFDDPDSGIAFDYPADFEVLEDVSFNRQAGSAAAATAGVGIDGTNLIAVQRFEQDVDITGKDLDEVRPTADMLFSQLAGTEVEGEKVEVGGLPALQYEIELSEPADGRTRATAIFDGETEYLVNCQSSPAEREAIEAACDMALSTLRVR